MNIQRLMLAVLRRMMWALCFFLPVKKNKILVSSYYGRGYGDNPKYIVEALLQANKNYRIIWLINKEEDSISVPQGVETVRVNSLMSIFHLTTAKVWIDNCRRSFKFKKHQQYYIQTWHGFALKRIEKDVADHLSEAYVKKAIKDSNAIDLIVSEATFMTKLYQNAFWYNGEIVQWGSPRNDILLKKELSEKARRKVLDYFKQDSDVKLVLYAPTFRSNRSLAPYSLDYMRVKKACEKKFGSTFKVLVRLHPNIMEKSSELSFDNVNVIDASGYWDMQELLAAADVVISDYSSLMFDFALSEKPCFQFATDIEEYKNDRNFYFQLDALPFSVSINNDNLEASILSFDQVEYSRELQEFFDQVGLIRMGDASIKCAQRIDEICN